jgi:hypothetical protein
VRQHSGCSSIVQLCCRNPTARNARKGFSTKGVWRGCACEDQRTPILAADGKKRKAAA